MQTMVKEKLDEIETVLIGGQEPLTKITPNCQGCDYFGFCSKSLPSPSPLPRLTAWRMV